MNTLDNLYEQCFIVNDDAIIDEHDDGLIIVKNIFKNPNLIINFQNLLSKWESCNSAKPGMMSLNLPYWTANYVLRQLFDFECEWRDSQTEFIYFYWNNSARDSPSDDLRSNNCLLPHTDADGSMRSLIFLVNLNHRPIRTGFWKFDGSKYETLSPDKSIYYKYSEGINESNIDMMTNNGKLDKEFDIEYHFNEAIMYPANRFHQPIIDTFYTRETPRILLRYCYNLADEFDD